MTLFPIDDKTVVQLLKEAQILEAEILQLQDQMQQIKSSISSKQAELKLKISACIKLSDSQNIIS